MRLLLWLFDRLLMIALVAAVVTMVAGRDTVEAPAGRLLDGLADAGAGDYRARSPLRRRRVFGG